MRQARSFIAAVLGLLLITASVSSQGKDKDKEPKKDPGRYPTEIGGKDLKAWMEDMRDEYDPTVRQTAIRTIVNFGPAARRAVPYLIAALAERDASVRGDAATALGVIGIDEKDDKNLAKGIKGLQNLVLDEQRPVRLHAVAALGRFGAHSKPAIKSLITALSDSQSWEVRKAAAEALSYIALDPMKGPDTAVFSALTAALAKDTCAPVRLEIIRGLYRLGKAPTEPTASAEKTALVARLKDRDKVVAIWARTLLMFVDSAQTDLNTKGLAALAKYLEDPDPLARVQAAQALGTLGPKAKAQVSDLIKAAGDKDVAVAAAAMTALGYIQDTDALPTLSDAATGKDQGLALTAIMALGYTQQPKAVPTLVKLLKDKEQNLRIQAAAALGLLGSAGKAAVDDLVEALNDKEPAVVIAAMSGLVQLRDVSEEKALPAIKKLTDSKDDAIKEAAAQAVKYLTMPKPKKS
jgi:HEAT repeat protein